MAAGKRVGTVPLASLLRQRETDECGVIKVALESMTFLFALNLFYFPFAVSIAIGGLCHREGVAGPDVPASTGTLPQPPSSPCIDPKC